jgi:N-acetylneuraminate synthase
MNSSPEIVVEVANLHEGSLGVAKSFVDIIGDAGVKTVKFQMHIAEEEGVRNEPFRIKFSDQDQTRQDYWRRVSLSLDSWLSLKSHCDNLNIEFLCTPFSIKAASLLHENKLVKRWKIASGQATDWTLIEYVAETRLPLIISTGLISDNELHQLKSAET